MVEKKCIPNPILCGLDTLKNVDSYLSKMNSFMRIFKIEGNLENNDENRKKMELLRNIFSDGSYYGLFNENGEKYITISVDIVRKSNKDPEKQKDYDETLAQLIPLQEKFLEKFKELFPTVTVRLIHLDEIKAAFKPSFDSIDSFLD